eukprot:gene33435-23995_t
MADDRADGEALVAGEPAAAAPATAASAAGDAESDVESAVEASMAIVGQHTDRDSCWVVVRGRVLDCSSYLGHHPGGAEILLRHAGRDATEAFEACWDYDVGALKDTSKLRRAARAAEARRERIRALAKYLEH